MKNKIKRLLTVLILFTITRVVASKDLNAGKAPFNQNM